MRDLLLDTLAYAIKGAPLIALALYYRSIARREWDRAQRERGYGRAEAMAAFVRLAKRHGLTVHVSAPNDPPPDPAGFHIECRLVRTPTTSSNGVARR